MYTFRSGCWSIDSRGFAKDHESESSADCGTFSPFLSRLEHPRATAIAKAGGQGLVRGMRAPQQGSKNLFKGLICTKGMSGSGGRYSGSVPESVTAAKCCFVIMDGRVIHACSRPIESMIAFLDSGFER